MLFPLSLLCCLFCCWLLQGCIEIKWGFVAFSLIAVALVLFNIFLQVFWHLISVPIGFCAVGKAFVVGQRFGLMHFSRARAHLCVFVCVAACVSVLCSNLLSVGGALAAVCNLHDQQQQQHWLQQQYTHTLTTSPEWQPFRFVANSSSNAHTHTGARTYRCIEAFIITQALGFT